MERLSRFLTYTPSILLLVLVFVLSLHTLTSINQDIGRHLTLGKMIWETQHVPDTNLFSYTWPDFPFVDHHWLAEVLLFLGERAVGLDGLIVVKAIILATAFGLALFAVNHRNLIVPACLIGLVGVGILIERTDVRPEILSFLFWGWYLFVLFGHREKLLWTLPITQLFWVNSHIYFFMGPLAFGLFFAQEWFTTRRIPSRRWILTGMGILVATLMNPSFIQGALYPLFVFRNYGYSIVENQSPFFLQAFSYPQITTRALWAGISLLVVSTIVNFRSFSKRTAGSMVAVITAILSLTMIRNFPLFALALVPTVLQNFSDRAIRISNKVPTLIVSVIFASLIFSVTNNQLGSQFPYRGQFGLDVPIGSQKGVDFVRANKLHGPLFNNFDVGSFLIWKLPEEKVFIDGRPEAYPADFIQNVYIKMQEDPAVWERESKRYGIQLVFWNSNDITPWSQKFVARMRKDAAWTLAYEDNKTLIFTRRAR